MKYVWVEASVQKRLCRTIDAGTSVSTHLLLTEQKYQRGSCSEGTVLSAIIAACPGGRPFDACNAAFGSIIKLTYTFGIALLIPDPEQW